MLSASDHVTSIRVVLVSVKEYGSLALYKSQLWEEVRRCGMVRDHARFNLRLNRYGASKLRMIGSRAVTKQVPWHKEKEWRRNRYWWD